MPWKSQSTKLNDEDFVMAVDCVGPGCKNYVR